MSAKKPWFKARTLWAFDEPDGSIGVCRSLFSETDIRVRVTDARELTAEKAVERVLQEVYERRGCCSLVRYCASAAGMTATVKNDKVRVRRVKR